MSIRARFDGIIKQCFRALGLEVQRLDGATTEEAVLRNLLRRVQPAVVLDIGANVGQFASSLRQLGYAGPIVSFEALPGIYEKLADNASSDPNWTIAPRAALGSRAGTIEINVAANTASSSLLAMRKVHVEAAPQSAYVGREKVRLARLDEASSGLLPPSGDLFMKIDTQGYEMEVLKGAGALLKRTVAMQIELSLVQLYEEAPTLPRMAGFVEDLGFEMFGVAPGFKDARSGRLLQVEGFFVRKEFA